MQDWVYLAGKPKKVKLKTRFLINLSKIVSKYGERGKEAYLFGVLRLGEFDVCETDFTSQAPAGNG